MSSKPIRPKWWLLYLIFPLLIALLSLDIRLQLSTLGHQVIQIGIILLIYGLVHAWLKANARALSATDQTQLDGKIRVIKIQPHELPMMNYEYKPYSLFQLSDSEIKGTLSNTFEMETINAEFTPSIDEVRKN